VEDYKIFFDEFDGGDLWDQITDDWVQFELACGLVKDKKSPRMSTSQRPSEITTWIRYKRAIDYVPEVQATRLPVFRSNMVAWWKNLQPAWRVENTTELPFLQPADSLETYDWSCLMCPGSNGILNVLLGIVLW
ncbi:hypothetical protein K474DRAFT_1569359, partial [Panus rudis PR-1116 ss-1]